VRHTVSIGEFIRDVRKAKKISQQELANRTGVSRTTIARFESGTRKPFFVTAVRLARALDFSLDDLAKVVKLN
jgi:transcriptional regulator with XRE-family HTH domain